MSLQEILVLFFQPIGLALFLVFSYGVCSRSFHNPRLVNPAMGIIFGFAALFSMLSPLELADGIIFDLRSLFLAMAAAFFGIVGGGIALAIGAVARLMIGGDGALLGVAGMVMAFGVGLAWARFIHPKLGGNIVSLLVLGGMTSTTLLVGLLLPEPVRSGFLVNVAPVLSGSYFLGALLLGKLILRERALLQELSGLVSASTRDSLTQILNRTAAQAKFEALSNNAHRSRGYAMLCIDVDRFKGINDTFGHLAGDQVLIEIARRISTCLRPDDIFARISGDEFIIVLSNLSDTQARDVAQRCKRAVSQKPVASGGASINVSISIGCSWVADMTTFQNLRLSADKALYRAKEQGRNCLASDNRAIMPQIMTTSRQLNAQSRIRAAR